MNAFLDGKFEVYGFTIDTLNYPLNPDLLCLNRTKKIIEVVPIWPVSLDFKNNTIEEIGRTHV